MTGTDTTALWTEFHRPLGAFLAKRVRRDADVEDVLQEVFARIHRSIDTLQRSERVSAWIFQIARNALIDFQRARATRADATTASPDVVIDEAAAQTEDAAADFTNCVKPVIAALPEPYREAIRLTELEGLTQAEAAERVGISLSGMKSRVQRGRDRLKEMILDCCHIELDARGSVTGCEPRRGRDPERPQE